MVGGREIFIGSAMIKEKLYAFSEPQREYASLAIPQSLGGLLVMIVDV